MPQGQTLNALDFAGSTGYAVGNFGTLLRTSDGGATWSALHSGVTQNLYFVRVLGKNGFIAGGDCALLRSDDGGATVQSVRFTQGGRKCEEGLVSFVFDPGGTGYLFRELDHALRTDDGGLSFSPRSNPDGRVEDGWVTGSNTAVVVASTSTYGPGTGTIQRTTDGGASWNQVASVTGQLHSVTFVNATVGYAVGSNTVLKTIDGGASWTTRMQTPRALRSVRCADELHCVVVSGGVYHTTDGFATLAPSTSAAAAGFGTAAVRYSSPLRVVGVGDTGVTWISSDGGSSFSRVGSDLSGGDVYGAIKASSPSLAWVLAYPNHIAKTTDGGATWTRIGVPTEFGFWDAAFARPDLGYALDQTSLLFRTANGGASWVNLGRPRVAALGLWASDDGHTVVLSGDGVARSIDGGRHFTRIHSPALRRARDWAFDRTGDRALFAHGVPGIAISLDDGKTWSPVRRPPSRLATLDFVDRRWGYALTADGRLWQTRDRGRRWREIVSVGSNPLLFRLSFADRLHGWIASKRFARDAGGWLLRTSDGGRSWRPQAVDSSAVQANGLVATSRSGGITVAAHGRLFFTLSGGDFGAPSSLSLALGPNARRVARVRVTGRLRPGVADAVVAIAAREDGSTGWVTKLVITGTDGSFSATLKLRHPAYVVAQWAGDGLRRGAGTPAVRVVPQ